MHVLCSSFWLIHNFDNNLYYDPLTVNHLFIFIMSRLVDENKVQLDLAFKTLFQTRKVFVCHSSLSLISQSHLHLIRQFKTGFWKKISIFLH